MFLGPKEMVNKTNADIKAAVSLIISENLIALKNVIKKIANNPSKTGFNNRKKARGNK